MFPIDAVNGAPWPPELAQAKLQAICADVHEHLAERDASHGIPADGKVYRADPATQTMTIDPELARLKHSGEEYQALVNLRWAEFCLDPRPLAEFAEHERTSTRRRLLEGAQAAAAKFNGNGKGAAVPDAAGLTVNGRVMVSPEEVASGTIKDPVPPNPVHPVAGHVCGQCGEICKSAGGLRLHMKAHEKAARIPRNG